MPTIKRYPNRKLYDTEAKRYVTLDGIAQLIRNGDEVMVIDHITEEDLTAVTLTQIIFEQQKKGGGFLPTSVLTGLVQAGGDTLNSLRRGLASPLDLWRHVDGEIERRMQLLIRRGELAREEGLGLLEKLLSLGGRPDESEEATSDSEEEAQSTLTLRGVPSRDEVDRLQSRIEALSFQLDTVLKEQADPHQPTSEDTEDL